MELKAELKKPYTEKEKIDFVVEKNHKFGYEIKETDVALEAWGYTQEEIEQQEKERIAMLSLTRGDVFRGLLMAKQVTRAQIRAMIENNELLTMLQKEMALIDFDEALNFYRGNELIDTIGLTLGITSEQLDTFFETNDYTVLLPKEEPTETPSEKTFNLEE
jgi:hypothetical protein